MPIKLSDLYTKIDVEPYGMIELLGLMLDDITWLVDPQTKALPACDFAVSLIHNHIVSPTLDIEIVSGWSDDLLAFVATHWLKDRQQHENALPTVLSFEEFKQAVYAYINEQLEETRESFDTFATAHQQLMTTLFNAVPSITHFTSGVNNIIDAIRNVVVRRETRPDIPDAVGKNWEGYSWIIVPT